jgi:membrane protein
MAIKELAGLLKATGSNWLEDKASRLGAALAYYIVFSLAPLLVIVIGIAGMVFRRDASQSQVIDQIQNLVGKEGGDAIRAMIVSASKPGSGIVGTVLGIIMLLVGAAGLFAQLQDALNTIWGVEPRPGRGLWGFVQNRFLSFSMVLGVGFLLMASLIITAALGATMQLLGDSQVALTGQIVNEVISLIVFSLLFAMIYRFLPDAKIAWGDVWLGAALTAFLFELGKFVIGFYLGHSGIASGYGAAGSLAALLVWLYYASQIFLLGAEFTRVYANEFGSRIMPTDNSELVTTKTRTEQGFADRSSENVEFSFHVRRNLMSILSKPSSSARTAVIYITAGVLTAVWSGIWYLYLNRNPPVNDGVWYWCYGLILTGIALFVIGLAIGRIGRSARHAELPPEEVTASVVKTDQEAATRAPIIAPLNPSIPIPTQQRTNRVVSAPLPRTAVPPSSI